MLEIPSTTGQFERFLNGYGSNFNKMQKDLGDEKFADFCCQLAEHNVLRGYYPHLFRNLLTVMYRDGPKKREWFDTLWKFTQVDACGDDAIHVVALPAKTYSHDVAKWCCELFYPMATQDNTQWEKRIGFEGLDCLVRNDYANLVKEQEDKNGRLKQISEDLLQEEYSRESAGYLLKMLSEN